MKPLHPAVIATALWLSGCASGPSIIEQDASSARYRRETAVEREAATATAKATLRACQLEMAAALDDRTSDAATVGRAVASACSVHSEAWLRAESIGEQPAEIDEMRRQWPALVRDLATQVVLFQRAKRAQ